MDFFQVSADDIKKATSGDKAVFVDGEEVVFTITELKEKEINGKPSLIVQTQVKSESDESNGLGHAFFVDDSAMGMKTWIKILRCFFTDDDIAQGVDQMSLVSRQIKSTARRSPSKKDPTKIYTNFYDFEAVDDMPDLDVGGGAEATVEHGVSVF